MIRASDYGRALFELARQEHREGGSGRAGTRWCTAAPAAA